MTQASFDHLDLRLHVHVYTSDGNEKSLAGVARHSKSHLNAETKFILVRQASSVSRRRPPTADGQDQAAANRTWFELRAENGHRYGGENELEKKKSIPKQKKRPRGAVCERVKRDFEGCFSSTYQAPLFLPPIIPRRYDSKFAVDSGGDDAVWEKSNQ